MLAITIVEVGEGFHRHGGFTADLLVLVTLYLGKGK